MPPNPDASDYALFRLERPIGDEWEWSSLAESAVNVEPTKIILMHHPSGQPLKCLFGERLRSNGNHMRYQHLTRTEPGAAGAPCFDVYGNPSVMHHAKDPDWKKRVRFGHAISISAIRSLLVSRGIDLA